MILLSFVILLNSVCSPIQWARYIDVRISEFRYTFESSQVAQSLLPYIPFYGDVN